MRVAVEAYSGFRADERPLRFRLGERWLGIDEVVDRWYDPDAMYFRVRADDGSVYVLRHIDGTDVWTLEAFRKA
jgi:hypothetical protein